MDGDGGRGTARGAGRALGRGLGRIEAQPVVHRGRNQRLQLGQGRDRHAAQEPRGKVGRDRRLGTGEARREVAAGGVAGQHHGSRHLVRRRGSGAGRILHHLRNARRGGEPVGGHRHRPPEGQRPLRQMRPGLAAEGHPVAAMEEDREAPRRALGQEQIEPLPRVRPVGKIQPGPGSEPRTEGCRLRLPARRVGFRALDEVAIGIGAARLFPFSHTDIFRPAVTGHVPRPVLSIVRCTLPGPPGSRKSIVPGRIRCSTPSPTCARCSRTRRCSKPAPSWPASGSMPTTAQPSR